MLLAVQYIIGGSDCAENSLLGISSKTIKSNSFNWLTGKSDSVEKKLLTLKQLLEFHKNY